LERRRPSVLMAAAKWWPLSARLAAVLIRHGCRVSALCPKGHPLELVYGLERVEHYAGVRSLESLAGTLREGCPDIVIPCDDGVVAQLHALHHQEPRLRSLIERSLGSAQSFAIVSNRFKLLTTAVELGIRVPEMILLAGKQDLEAWHDANANAVLKIDGDSGGKGVRISGSLRESLAAWRELGAPLRLSTAWKRLAIDRDPLALWMCRSCAEREIIIQRLIHGRPANSMLACRNGELLSLVSVLPLVADGPTGAATIVQRIHDDRMAQAAAKLAKRLQLTGFFGLDFMIETDTGIPYLIEMNPRCTQLGHLEFADQGSLAGAFAANLRGELPPPAERPVPLDTIAIFPQALQALDRHGRYRDRSYLDVPWDEPRLAAELQLAPWPERRWIARLYHAVRPIQRTTPIDFDHLVPGVDETARVVNIRLRAANDGSAAVGGSLAHENSLL